VKIAQVCPYFLPSEGGVERHVLNTSEELARRGHEVHVFTNAQSRDMGLLPSQDQVRNIPVHRFKPVAKLGEFGSLWPGFFPEILAGGFDVIHAHSFRHPHTDISAWSGRLSGSKSVLTSHSPFHPPGVRGPLARGLVPLYDRVVAPFTLRAFDNVVALTPGEAELLASLGAPRGRISVIPNGVESIHFQTADYRAFERKFGLDGTVLLYLGRINRTKGLDTLLQSFAYVAKEHNDARLVLAGPATSKEEVDYLDMLNQLTQKLGVSQRVTFTGRLTEEDKLAALERCSLFVLPSVYEPFGIVLLEAAAHGKVIVSTRTEGPQSIIRHGVNGVLVQPGDPTALAVSLVRVLSDEPYRARLSSEARAMALGYTWGAIVDRLESIYRGEVPS